MIANRTENRRIAIRANSTAAAPSSLPSRSLILIFPSSFLELVVLLALARLAGDRVVDAVVRRARARAEGHHRDDDHGRDEGQQQRVLDGARPTLVAVLVPPDLRLREELQEHPVHLLPSAPSGW